MKKVEIQLNSSKKYFFPSAHSNPQKNNRLFLVNFHQRAQLSMRWFLCCSAVEFSLLFDVLWNGVIRCENDSNFSQLAVAVKLKFSQILPTTNSLAPFRESYEEFPRILKDLRERAEMLMNILSSITEALNSFHRLRSGINCYLEMRKYSRFLWNNHQS